MQVTFRDQRVQEILICPFTCPNLNYLTFFLLFVLPQIDLQSEVEVALQSPTQGGCREVATILACVQVLLLLLHDDNISKVSNTHLTCVLHFKLIVRVCAMTKSVQFWLHAGCDEDCRG